MAMRYKPTVFTGSMMIHCHRLAHEDQGMMGDEEIKASGSTPSCS